MSILRSAFLFPLFFCAACASLPRGLRDGVSRDETTPEAIAAAVPRGSILVIGEAHGNGTHRRQQMKMLEALRAAGHRVSVGLEFFPYIHQADVDAWRKGALSEKEFLNRIEWGQPPFAFYLSQAAFPGGGSETVALNSSRRTTSIVAKQGLGALPPELAKEVPPDFALGNDDYKKLFAEEMHALPDGTFDNMFAAQSLWDDTMAWRADLFNRRNPEETLVIIVGDFHVQFGLGLPSRLRARTKAPVFTLSLVDAREMSSAEARHLVSRGDLSRANWVWFADSSR